MVLPEMYHFVNQGGDNLPGLPVGETERIEGYFIGNFLGVGSLSESLSAKITIGAFMPLHGNQTGR